jgi:hypothetical protein
MILGQLLWLSSLLQIPTPSRLYQMQSVYFENDFNSVFLYQALLSHTLKNITTDLDTLNIIDGKHKYYPSRKHAHWTTLDTAHEISYSWKYTFSTFSIMISLLHLTSIEP